MQNSDQQSMWEELVDRMIDKARSIFDSNSVSEGEVPKIVACALLARTINHVEASLLLLTQGYIVEARTIARSCYENMFWISALGRDSDRFIRDLELHDAMHRIKHANGLIARSNELDFDINTLTEFKNGLEETYGKVSPIDMASAAARGGVDAAYIIYRELSTDAAHPSATSLSRHFTDDDGSNRPGTLRARPSCDPVEQEETLEFLCQALLGVSIAANLVIVGQSNDEMFEELSEAYINLSNLRKRP